MPSATVIMSPSLECPELPEFFTDKLGDVRTAFRPAACVALGQAWRSVPESDFTPGHVWTGWRADSLLVFAELEDVDIVTAATAHNQRMWELGDTFEMFLQPENAPHYVELHVTPNNCRLQLGFPSTAALRQAQAANAFDDYLRPDYSFRSRVWRRPENNRWFVYAEIPATVVDDTAKSPAESRWRFSFSRYDYVRGRPEPIISSTSPHRVVDFHRREEWGTLAFAHAPAGGSNL